MGQPLNSAQKAWATRRARAAAIALPAASSLALSLCEPGSIATMADADLLALFANVGAAVSQRFLKNRPALSSWNTVVEYLRSAMAFRTTEQFRVLFLDKKNCLIADEAMGEGTVDHVPVYPREVVKRALEHNATALILVHNHPSGDTTPSAADIKMTKALVDALQPIGITVHDHLIVGRTEHTSLKAKHLF